MQVQDYQVELMRDDYMHGFGDATNTVRIRLYNLAAGTGRLDLIPERRRISYEGEMGREFATFDVFKANMVSLLADYSDLESLILGRDNTNGVRSEMFLGTKALCDRIGDAVGSFNGYLLKNPTEEDFLAKFKPHEDELGASVRAINAVFLLRGKYEREAGDVEPRTRWMEKRPMEHLRWKYAGLRWIGPY